MKIRGNTVGTTMKRPDFNQTNPKKSDYIKNNPIPEVTGNDEGKIVRVMGGKYSLEDIPEREGETSVHIGSEPPTSDENVWVDTSGSSEGSAEEWTFTLEDGTTVKKMIAVIG